MNDDDDDDDGSGIPPVQIPLARHRERNAPKKASLPSSRATRGRRNGKTRLRARKEFEKEVPSRRPGKEECVLGRIRHFLSF